MKKYLYFLIMIILSIAISGCNKAKPILNNNSEPKVEYKLQEKFYFITKNKSEIVNPEELCRKYYPKAKTDIIDKDSEFITNTWGQPLYNLKLVENIEEKNMEKSIWIYPSSKESPTSIYIFFVDNKVNDYKIDEFNGLDESIVKMLFEEIFKINK